ncbi:MAG TPA: protein kinase [Steroidobacteraceae bacterium]|nr:protein kinase [Steroidobacteraceae bacterium]
MSVEPLDSMSDLWTKWQGHLVNGTYRIGRFLGGSDHSGVFVTLLGQQQPVEVALKLMPAGTNSELQLRDLRTAAGLSHPNLIRLLKTGRCELDGEPFLYVVMEYAEQNLAQILRSRSLTDEEAREVLVPTLNALAFLHGRKLVQGQLKPTNLLAVGDKLKLASDTIRPISETGASRSVVSAYDPPEYRDGGYSTAGDIWGLGMTLLEALGRRLPAGQDDGRGVVAVPPDFSPAFRDIVVQCLSRRPFDRPKLTEIDAWLRRQATEAAWAGGAGRADATGEADTITFELEEPAAPVGTQSGPAAAMAEPLSALHVPEPIVAEPLGTRTARDPPRSSRPPDRSFLAPLILAALAAIALGWVGVRALRGKGHATPPPVATTMDLAPQPASPAPAPAAPVTGSSGRVHEEIPDVPAHARQTIHGRIRISIRVIVDSAGNVVGARADQAGPSRYFARLALEAAKKWTFPPVDTPARRLRQIRFEFTRDGVKAHAVPLQ